MSTGYLQQKADEAMALSLASPKDGWLLMRQVENAARSQDDPFLAAQAAFHLGRLANEYGRPTLAQDPLNRAKQLFTNLNRPDWLAAVTWQRHYLCWASPNLSITIQELKTALKILENGDNYLRAFIPHCQLTLAYAKLILGDFDGLSELLQQCTNYFTETGDKLHQARTIFVRSGLLRRTAPFQQAKDASFEGLSLAKQVNSAADIGRFHCQIGYNYWLCDGDYESAARSFQTAIDQFQELEIPGWLAQSQDGMAQIYIATGRLSNADNLIQSALSTFQEENAFGLQPAALLNAGWLEMFKGNYELSLEYLEQSKAGYIKSDKHRMASVVQMHLGETDNQLGRFQHALQNLEQAYSNLQSFPNQSGRLAECCLRLARLWTKLNNPKQALAYLEKVKNHALETDYDAALLEYYLTSAAYFNDQLESQKALKFLADAIDLATQQNNSGVEALCRRQLAKTLAQQQRLGEAAEQLTLAETTIKEMGIRHEQAACLLIWGDIYHQQGRQNDTQTAWQKAEQLSQKLMPDINWQAAAALARLAEETDDKESALAHYQQMIESLKLLRQGFWQPELAGNYLKRPINPLNRAILLSAQNGRPQETLRYIEEIKAQTTAYRLQAHSLFQQFNPTPPDLQNTLAEIRWLQQNLRETSTFQQTLFRSVEFNTKFNQLDQRINEFTQELTRLQRQHIDNDSLTLNSYFNLEQFRRKAQLHLGTHWIALDYFYHNSQIICLELTSTNCNAHFLPLPDGFWDAVEGFGLTNGDRMPPFSMLKAAGEKLLPTAVRHFLLENPETTLIIAPHRNLHRLPWPALHISGSTYLPLVNIAAPVIVPSLQTLSLLWQREEKETKLEKGLLLAISQFQNHYANLPAVKDEVSMLVPLLGKNSRTLLDEQATSEALLSEMEYNRRQFDFWHIATHAFYDAYSGRLSGLALYDRDLLLDELWQLAPLPNVVIFSACSGSKSYIVEGDEHISLTNACLTAGANHVIGSIWDIPDGSMPALMTAFYSQFLRGNGNTAVPVSKAQMSKSLAQAQRLAWKNGESWQQWAGFRCTGRP